MGLIRRTKAYKSASLNVGRTKRTKASWWWERDRSTKTRSVKRFFRKKGKRKSGR